MIYQNLYRIAVFFQCMMHTDIYTIECKTDNNLQENY